MEVNLEVPQTTICLLQESTRIPEGPKETAKTAWDINAYCGKEQVSSCVDTQWVWNHRDSQIAKYCVTLNIRYVNP